MFADREQPNDGSPNQDYHVGVTARLVLRE
jgi:hypothetical protein